jgi:CHAD domain-containing protein
VGYELEASEGAGEGIVRIVLARLDHALAQLDHPPAPPGQLADTAAEFDEAVHTARKDLKKARSAARLVRSGLSGKAFRETNHTLRDAGRSLSGARDAAVIAATLAGLGEHYGPGTGVYAMQAIAAWSKALDGQRDGDGEGEGLPAVVEAADRIRSSRAQIERWEPSGGWRLLSPGLETAYGDGRDRFRALGSAPDDEAVHQLRKRVKDLWYQLRILQGCWPDALDGVIGEAHQLADLLGDHHDLSLLRDGLEDRDVLADGPALALGELAERRRQELLAEAAPLAARLYAEKPKAFERRIHAYWRAWRHQRR